MSNTDSFIDEVTEEVRRDRLFAMMRRYGWIAVVIVLVLVGGTAWNEWRKARTEAAAQARGDAINAALTADGPEARGEALAALAGGEDESAVIAAFLAADQLVQSDDIEGASAALEALASRAELSPLYRDLAQIKRLAIGAEISDLDRAQILETLSQPGAPYRTIATELRALDTIAAGNADEGVEILQTLLNDAETSPQHGQRVADLIISLGETPELASPSLDGSALAPSQE